MLWSSEHQLVVACSRCSKVVKFAYDAVTPMTLWRLWRCDAYDAVTPMMLWRLWRCDAYDAVTPMTLWRCKVDCWHSSLSILATSSIFSIYVMMFHVLASFSRIPLFTHVYKKMPRVCKYIQSFQRVRSVKTSIESGHIYQYEDVYGRFATAEIGNARMPFDETLQWVNFFVRNQGCHSIKLYNEWKIVFFCGIVSHIHFASLRLRRLRLNLALGAKFDPQG
jgi:hypothetical protein